MELAYLLNPAFQYENRNGKPLTGGFLKVFEHGTTIPYITWKNFDGDRNPAEIPLNDLGMAVVLVEADKVYDVFCWDINRVEQWSRVNVGTYGGAGGASGASGDGFGAIRCTGVSRLTTDGNFQYSVQEVNGVSLDVLSGVLRADTGWYHYDATVRLIWESEPANRETQVKLAAYLNDDLASDVTSFDMGYSHDETVRVSGEVKVLADDTVFNINITGMPAGMEAQLVDFGMHTVNAQGGSGGSSEGVTDVLQNGSSVVDNGVARVTVPTKVSDLQNDSGFVTGADIRQLPASTSADEGNVLTVDANGDPQWEPPSGGGGDVSDVTVNGTSVVTNHVAEITVPTKTSDLTNDSGFITSADLPTVNDGTLTIQKNGATVDTFTANSSTNKTVNIAVPTKTSDLTNDSGFVTSGDLPTVNDGTLTIQKNGTTIDTFTANSSSNKTVDISVPTKTSDLTNDSGFVTSADLPTVNDGTLTIQKNGTTIDTFSANSSSNKTVDISVPTKTSDLTNDSGFITSSDIPAAPVSDVQVDGVSVVSSGVANITLPTVNDGTLTIQKNGTTIDTFTANSSANKTVDISVPTKTSDLNNDSGFITSSSLPTVNDGTLTIQKNGTTIDTFSANSSSNKTVDISVPTKTSDLNNDSGFITSAALPTVNDATLTIQKNGTTVDTFTANASSNKTVNITVPTNTSDLNNNSGFITSGDIPAQVQSDWRENDSSDPAYIQNKPTTTPIVAGANITISDTQNGVVVSTDETVLYDCSNNYVYGTNSVTLSESYKNFEIIKILNSKGNVQFYYPENNQGVALFTLTNISNSYLWLIPWTFTSDTVYAGATGKLWTVGTTTAIDVPNNAPSSRWIQPIKIIGVHRIANN